MPVTEPKSWRCALPTGPEISFWHFTTWNPDSASRGHWCQDKALEWFRSYLVDRTTSVKVNNSRSCCSLVKYRVPQGSVLGPTLFNVYCRPLGRIIRKHDISYHMYADDSQLYVDFSPGDEKNCFGEPTAVHSRSKRMVERNFLTVKW